MDKSTRFDIDHKNTVACITQAGRRDRYTKLKTEVGVLRQWLQAQRQPGEQLHLTFEVSGLSGLLYDGVQWRTSQITHRGVDYDSNGDGKSDPIPEARLYEFWMSRPIVVVDRNNRVIVVFNDYMQGQHVTAAWSDDRVNWRLINLTTENIGLWEPTYDVELWQRQNKLHMLYQPWVLGQESSPISVLEWDSKRISQ